MTVNFWFSLIWINFMFICKYNTLLCPESIAAVMQYNNRMLLTDNCPCFCLFQNKREYSKSPARPIY